MNYNRKEMQMLQKQLSKNYLYYFFCNTYNKTQLLKEIEEITVVAFGDLTFENLQQCLTLMKDIVEEEWYNRPNPNFSESQPDPRYNYDNDDEPSAYELLLEKFYKTSHLDISYRGLDRIIEEMNKDEIEEMNKDESDNDTHT